MNLAVRTNEYATQLFHKKARTRRSQNADRGAENGSRQIVEDYEKKKGLTYLTSIDNTDEL